MDLDRLFSALAKSKFRSSFHLKEKDLIYVKSKGVQVIRDHAYDFVRKRLAPKVILNDGKQTPFKGHPVFVAMHATGTCCRGCLEKWHHISKDKVLSEGEIDYIVDVIMFYINREISES